MTTKDATTSAAEAHHEPSAKSLVLVLNDCEVDFRRIWSHLHDFRSIISPLTLYREWPIPAKMAP